VHSRRRGRGQSMDFPLRAPRQIEAREQAPPGRVRGHPSSSSLACGGKAPRPLGGILAPRGGRTEGGLSTNVELGAVSWAVSGQGTGVRTGLWLHHWNVFPPESLPCEACRRRGMTRTQLYKYKRRFQTHGFEGLEDLPPTHKTHPQTTPPEVEVEILALSLEHPGWGRHRLSAMMRLRGRYVSGSTIQNILARNGMATMCDRLLKLEEKAASEPIELTAELIALIEKANPCYRERRVESSWPGELLAQDIFFVGHLKGVAKVYLQAVVDTYGSYGFGFLQTGKLPECAVAVLHNDVLPFYRSSVSMSRPSTDNGREYCGKDTHPYELYLALNDIEHRRTKVGRPQTNGFMEMFNRTALDEFFRKAFREKSYESVDALLADLDAWIVHYNTEGPHLGYGNVGRRPMKTINTWRLSREKAKGTLCPTSL